MYVYQNEINCQSQEAKEGTCIGGEASWVLNREGHCVEISRALEPETQGQI